MTFLAGTAASDKYASGTNQRQRERRSWYSTMSWMYVPFLPPLPHVIDFVTGEERVGTSKWIPFARALHCGVVPYAREAGCGGSQGGTGTTRRRAGAAENEAQHKGRRLMRTSTRPFLLPTPSAPAKLT